MKHFINIQKPQMRKARIEIIPMIDTIFFLLVFFMFTSLSMVQMKGMGVSLPKDNPSVTKPPPHDVISVDAGGNYALNGSLMDPADIEPQVQEDVTKNPQTVLIVSVNPTLSTQFLINVMDIVNQVTTPDGDSAAVMIATQRINPKTGAAVSGGR